MRVVFVLALLAGFYFLALAAWASHVCRCTDNNIITTILFSGGGFVLAASAAIYRRRRNKRARRD